jgi:hypothetical protein
MAKKNTIRRVFALLQPRAVVAGWRSSYKGSCGIYSNKAPEMKSSTVYQACETKASRGKRCYSES